MAKDESRDDNPLAFVDRLLDDERDSNLHFGDVRFWQHLEHINTDQIYRTKSLEYKTMKLMFCEAVFYLLFLFVLTRFIVEQRSSDLFESRNQQYDFWAGCHRDGVNRYCRMHDVKDAASLMGWLREDLVPKAFTDRELYPSVVQAPSVFRLQDGTMAWTPRYVGDTKTSVLVGTVRIRQLRVQYNKGCSVSAVGQVLADLDPDVSNDCFAPFEESVESKMRWHSSWTPEHIQPHYDFQEGNQTNQIVIEGYHGVYPPSGFVVDMPLNLTGAKDRLSELHSWNWLDLRTRAVVIELTTLNMNVNIFVHTRLLFEFPATGGIVMKQEAYAFRALSLSLGLMQTDDLPGAFLFLVMTCAMHLMLACEVIWLISKNGFRYVTYFWSVVDLIILCLFFILVCVNIDIFAATAREPNLQPEVIGDPEMFFPVGKVVPRLRLAGSILALLGLAAWLKILKYFSLMQVFMGFVRVVERCFVNLLLFACLLFIVLYGFAVALHIGFGKENDLFSSVWSSLVAVIVAPAGGVDLSPIFAEEDLLGPVLIFVYIIVVFLLLLNTFKAICVDTYTVATFQMNETFKRNNSNPTAIFLWTYYSALKGVKLVGKEKEEDKGGPDEQLIALTSLPEAIAIEYLKTKKRMEAILDAAQAEMDDKKREAEARAQLMDGTMDLSETPSPMNALEDRRNSSASGDSDIRPPPLAMPAVPEGNPPPEDLTGMMVNRVQLQRMLDDDPVLREICSTAKAVEVVRRFRVDQSGVDPYEAVAQLQANVTKKLRELEEAGLNLSFNEMETLKTVSQELHSALTESQKEWRAELLTVLQMASLLSEALIRLTQKLERVQTNHNQIALQSGAN